MILLKVFFFFVWLSLLLTFVGFEKMGGGGERILMGEEKIGRAHV